MRVSHYAFALFLSAPALGAENLDRDTPRALPRRRERARRAVRRLL